MGGLRLRFSLEAPQTNSRGRPLRRQSRPRPPDWGSTSPCVQLFLSEELGKPVTAAGARAPNFITLLRLESVNTLPHFRRQNLLQGSLSGLTPFGQARLLSFFASFLPRHRQPFLLPLSRNFLPLRTHNAKPSLPSGCSIPQSGRSPVPRLNMSRSPRRGGAIK